MTAELDEIDSALRLVDRELWIITASDGPRRGGLVATWVSVASIDRQRPVLLACLAPNRFTTELRRPTSKAHRRPGRRRRPQPPAPRAMEARKTVVNRMANRPYRPIHRFFRHFSSQIYADLPNSLFFPQQRNQNCI